VKRTEHVNLILLDVLQVVAPAFHIGLPNDLLAELRLPEFDLEL
jgi:hypothetical protein